MEPTEEQRQAQEGICMVACVITYCPIVIIRSIVHASSFGFTENSQKLADTTIFVSSAPPPPVHRAHKRAGIVSPRALDNLTPRSRAKRRASLSAAKLKKGLVTGSKGIAIPQAPMGGAGGAAAFSTVSAPDGGIGGGDSGSANDPGT